MKVLSYPRLLALAAAVSLSISAQAEKWIGLTNAPTNTQKVGAGCLPPSTAQDLDINNIRALIQSGGDMWWDLQQTPKYEVPKGSKKTSLYAGSLWLGGVDVSNQLKVAAQRFRGTGVDFYTGPLRIDNAETDGETCTKFDKFFLTYKQEVVEFVAWNEAKAFDAANGTNTAEDNFPGYSIPASIQNWPGNNEDPNYDFYLAPYVDVDGVEGYNYLGGDYPAYDVKGTGECRTDQLDQIYGDQNLWWVFNDNGNIHGESGAQPIGMEIRAQAFAFAANDEVNNMTFYNYKVINRSTFTLTDTYFGFWVDPDLGNALDDFIGCDVGKGLGFCYNGDDYDQNQGGAFGYLDQPAAIGVDFFQGPFQDSDGEDNLEGVGPGQALNGVGYGDSIVDNERFGMRRFLYHNNASGVVGDPDTGPDYYNFLQGKWKDGNNMVYGGTGYPTGCSAPWSCVPSDFMFPGDTDPLGWGTDGVAQSLPWSEVTAGNSPGDRRFVQSAGPFTLAPGASNYVTVGVVWAQATSGGALASLEALKQADRKTQAAFNNCFKILEGPFAPELSFQEMDQSLIMYIGNPVSSNNYQEKYAQIDPSNVPPDSVVNANGSKVALTAAEKAQWQTYYFQGYKIYQLKNKDVSVTELDDANQARLAAQCDMKDGVTRIINYEFDDNLKASVPKLRADGADNGIFHSVKLTEDLFASGNKALVNHKQVYYMAVAYAYNYSPYNMYDPTDPAKLNGQKLPYIQSGKAANGAAVKVFSAIPHKTSVEQDGTVINSDYGDGLEITQVEGTGNGGNFLRLKQESIDKILAGDNITELMYEANNGPVVVKVIDPLNVPKGDFVLKVLEEDATKNLAYTGATWELTFNGQVDGRDTTIVYTSDNSIDLGGEQLLMEVGLSVTMLQTTPIKDGVQDPINYGLSYLGAEIEFEDPSQPWLTGVEDQDGTDNGTNWIRSGTATVSDNPSLSDAATAGDDWMDPKQIYEGILGGTWAPFKLCAISPHGPSNSLPGTSGDISSSGVASTNPLEYLQSVDIVFTKDKSQWTRCVVLETQEDNTVSIGGAKKGFLRKSLSVNKNGQPMDTTGLGGNLANLPASNNPDDANYIGAYGMGWFPGYAINIETGERLNMAFSEDSWLQNENGSDMIWNPTENITEGPFNETRLGGKHYIYVFRSNTVNDNRTDGYTLTVRKESQMPAYDKGAFAFNSLKLAETASGATLSRYAQRVYNTGMWCSLPLLAEGYSLNSVADGLIPSKVTVRIRVAKPYQGAVYGANWLSTGQSLPSDGTYFVERGPITYNGTNYARGGYFYGTAGSSFSIASTANANTADTTNNVRITSNAGRPLYKFNSDKYATVKNDLATAEDGLNLITAVPNPYYAYSEYETDRLDNRIKIINLPKTCTVRIYATDGVLIRTLTKDDEKTTYLEWDLKNSKNISVASGIYVIHIDAPGIGEQVVKWFGMMRPIDLDSF